MRYGICKTSAPKMLKLGNGTKSLKKHLFQASKGVREPLIPILFPILGAHFSGKEFQYPDLRWKEMVGKIAIFVAECGENRCKTHAGVLANTRRCVGKYTQVRWQIHAGAFVNTGWSVGESYRVHIYFTIYTLVLYHLYTYTLPFIHESFVNYS